MRSSPTFQGSLAACLVTKFNGWYGLYHVIKVICLKSSVLYIWVQCFAFPVPFYLQYAFQLANIPALFMHSHLTLPELERTELRERLCLMYQSLQRLIFTAVDVQSYLQRVGSCPVHAPRFMAYWFITVIGVLGPLYVCYIMEIYFRMRFASQVALVTTPDGMQFRVVSEKGATFCIKALVRFCILLVCLTYAVHGCTLMLA